MKNKSDSLVNIYGSQNSVHGYVCGGSAVKDMGMPLSGWVNVRLCDHRAMPSVPSSGRPYFLSPSSGWPCAAN